MAALQGKVIITCAVTGSIHTPTMTPHLPITPKEIADESIAAAKAGAAIIHLHARDPKDGRPTPDPKVFMEFLPAIKEATDAVINITTGGGHNMTVQQRLAAPLAAQPEMCSFNMGSMNFGLYPDARPLQGVQARVGAAVPGGEPRLHLPQHLQGHRVHVQAARRRLRHDASSSSATTSGISTTSRTSSSASSSSRRSSCRRSSAFSAASAPTPTTSCT